MPAKRRRERSQPSRWTKKEFGEAEDSEDKIKTIILWDEESGCMAAHIVEQKGSVHQWAVQRIEDIRKFGHTDIIMMGDGEPALVLVQREIVNKRSAGSVHQNPPADDPQAKGAVERGVQDFMNQFACDKDRATTAHPDEDRHQLKFFFFFRKKKMKEDQLKIVRSRSPLTSETNP